MNVRQLAVGGLDSNFSYILLDEESGEAALVDPCGDVRIIRSAIAEFPALRPRYILLTHGHNDHCSGVREVHVFFDAPVAAHPRCPFKCDMLLRDHQRLPLGNQYVECIYTPGHSTDSVVYRMSDDSALFTGDTLFIDWCGFCDAKTMFHTLRQILYPLADSNEVYPGHNYGHAPHAPLGQQKRENPYLSIREYDRFCEELRKL